MNPLDMRTVVTSGVVSSILCALVVGALWAQNRSRHAGVGLWLSHFVLQSA